MPSVLTGLLATGPGTQGAFLSYPKMNCVYIKEQEMQTKITGEVKEM